MDPKALSNLDPKLRETYERVMGTTSPSPAASTPSATSTPPLPGDGGTGASPEVPAATPVQNPLETNMAAQTPAAPSLTPPPAQPVNPWQTPQTGMPSSPNPFTSSGQSLPSPASITGQAKGTSPVIRVLYIIGAVIFFALYTIFWIKVFKLPFLF